MLVVVVEGVGAGGKEGTQEGQVTNSGQVEAEAEAAVSPPIMMPSTGSPSVSQLP